MLKISFWRPMQQLRRSSPQRAGRRDEAGCFASGRSSTSIPRSRGRDFGYLTPDRRLRRLRRKTRRLILQTHTGLATLCAAKERTCDGCTGCYGCGGRALTRLQIAAASGAPPGRPSCGRGSRHACGRISRGCGQGRTRSRTKPEANILMTACVACGRVVWDSQRVARSATSSRSDASKEINIVTSPGHTAPLLAWGVCV